MALIHSLKGALSVARARLRAQLTADERVEERGGERGWRPQAAVTGAEAGAEAGRDRTTGGPLRDVPAADPSGIPRVGPDAEALASYEAGGVWDLTGAVGERVAVARERGAGSLILAVTLSHCGWSDRAVEALVRGRGLWEPRAEVLIAQAGDRLAKVYFRDLRLGSLQLSLPTFPAALCFDLDGGALVYRALAFDPLGPSPDHEKIAALLAGESVVAPGSDHFVATACTGGFCQRIDAAGGWSAEVRAELAPGGAHEPSPL